MFILGFVIQRDNNYLFTLLAKLSLTGFITLQESPSLPMNKSFSSGQEICFSIRPSLGGRKGWKIMPEAGGDAIEDPGITLTNVLKIILTVVSGTLHMAALKRWQGGYLPLEL